MRAEKEKVDGQRIYQIVKIRHGAMMVMQQTAPAQSADPAVEDEWIGYR